MMMHCSKNKIIAQNVYPISGKQIIESHLTFFQIRGIYGDAPVHHTDSVSPRIPQGIRVDAKQLHAVIKIESK